MRMRRSATLCDCALLMGSTALISTSIHCSGEQNNNFVCSANPTAIQIVSHVTNLTLVLARVATLARYSRCLDSLEPVVELVGPEATDLY